ncbi:MAG: acido-empty-quinoprotein group A, partial [Vicinamibacterales bacterium]
MTSKRWLVALACVAAPALLTAQGRGIDPADIRQPLADQWTTYNGDYSGRRYSALTQINKLTVKNLTLAWVAKLTGASLNPAGAGGGRGGGRGGGASL